MIKKGILLTTAIVTAACIFSACTQKTGQQTDLLMTEQEQNTEEQNMANATDLKEDTETGVCIDYVIESYQNIQQFGYRLFSQHLNSKNPVISPVSAYLALTIAGCGADGATREEFYDVLGKDMIPLSDDLMNRFPKTGDLMKLSIANSAWIDDKFVVDNTWLGTVKSLMDTEVVQTELSTPQTMNKINDWIEAKTGGLIHDMLTVPLDLHVRLALFNTIYFKGKWECPFDPQNTYKEAFYLQRGQEENVQADMMNMYLTELEYLSNDFMEGVILPYQQNEINSNETLAFIALKPTGDKGVRDLYSQLPNEVRTSVIENKQTYLVNLKLPKFEVTFDEKLNKSLINMGLTECFDEDKANFDQLGKTLDGDKLFINLVQQKAKIIVDEEGTEAAAATEILMCDRGAAIETDFKEMYFNEPFIYIILDLETEIPLFIGILDNPLL
ncbi:MAG: serpin family protein [Lachnospiraceae bacterium]|nr:serpin family protein [Lachnospiraceae bacterium]